MPRYGIPVLALLMTAALATPAFAQNEPADQHAVGLYISNIAGSGLTYTRTFSSGWGFHVSGIGWGQGGSTFANVGAAVTRDIDRREFGTLYGLLAVGTGIGSFFGGGGLSATNNVQANIAPGIGFAWGPLNLEVGYSVYSNAGGVGFTPAGGLGLNWRF